MPHAYFDDNGYHTSAPRKARRPSLHVMEQDCKGEYSVATFDPLGSVIGYLRCERWNESRGRNEAERIFSLADAIEICVDAYNR